MSRQVVAVGKGVLSFRPGRCFRSAWTACCRFLVLFSAVAAQAQTTSGPQACKPGYVWREACGPNEHVCVTPIVKAQTVQDNSQALSRRVANGANGPDTCAGTYVWREACGPQDHVCVTPAVKAQAAADNLAAPSRYANPSVALPDVLTQHNDAARTGTNLNETVLTPANVTPSTFGRLYERAVEGQVIAQPLYESNQWVPGKGLRNVVYVATRKNWVYAFDADDLNPDPRAGQLWSHPVQVSSASTVPFMCKLTRGPVGISSTPVIDRATDTMYVVARHSDASVWIHALDLATGLPKPGTPGSVRITAPGFVQSLELNRAGLLLQNGAIVVAFSALNCDNKGWRGWVFAYRAPDLKQVGVFSTSDGSPPGAGIWQSGSGLVGDGSHVYFETGNRQGGGPTKPDNMLDESFVKLALGPAPNYGLTLASSYTVSNRAALNEGDTDLGSGGPTLLPGGRLIGGGKQGKLYVLNSSTMAAVQNAPTAGPVPKGGSDGFQAFVNTWHDDASQPVCTDVAFIGRTCYLPRDRYEDEEMTGPNIHSSPNYWAGPDPRYGLLYNMPEKDYLRAFRYDKLTGLVETTPHVVSKVRAPDGMPGGFLSLSAQGSRNAIIWALIPKADGQWVNGPGRMVAFDALTLNELWRDDDNIGFAKFMPPTVAGGKVFRVTFADKLIVYGLTKGGTTRPCYDIDQKYQNYTEAEGLLGAPANAEQATPDGLGRYRHYKNGSIYWTASTCAWEVHGPVKDKWSDMGWEKGPLGYPLSDDTVAADGRGHFSDFQNGSIYWTALTGAHDLRGAIRSQWLNLGAERSVLGYPISDETEELDGSGRFNVFEHGTMHWQRDTNVVTVNANASVMMTMAHANHNRPGAEFAKVAMPEGNPQDANVALCQQQCADNARCISWTLAKPSFTSRVATCSLKDDMPLERGSSCCVAGGKVEIRPTGMTAMQGRIDRPGSDFASFDLPTPDPLACQGECGRNAACRAWVYSEPNALAGPRCWFKSTVLAGVANGMTISGSK